jgi:hypothetical protein
MAETLLSADQIRSSAELGDEANALFRENQAPQEYLNLLIEKSLFSDAIKFLAHALPKREAVWWAWFCARRAAGAEPPPKIKAALDATEKWIAQPNEPNRRAAKAAADAATFGTAAGCAGLGAFFSGGSLAPPEAPVVPPAPDLTAKAVAGAVTFAAAATEPEKAPEKFRAFLDQGLDVARRIKLWGS